MAGRNVDVGRALLILGGPISNLALASGGIALLAIFLDLDAELIGTAIFGLYLLGLSLIYVIMGPAIRLMGFRRIFQAVILLEGLVFVLFLAAYLTP